MRVNVKRAKIGAAAGAVAGLLLALYPFLETPLCLPGYLVLRIFMDSWSIGHGGIVLLGLTNPIAYGALGFLVGAFLPVGRRTLLVFAGGVGVVVLTGVGYCYGPRWFRHIQWEHRARQAMARLSEDPNDVPALYQIGHYYAVNHNDLMAAEYYRKIVALEAESDHLSLEAQRCLLSLAIICRSRGDLAAAEEYYRQFLASEPDLEHDPVLNHNNHFYLMQRVTPSGAEARD